MVIALIIIVSSMFNRFKYQTFFNLQKVNEKYFLNSTRKCVADSSTRMNLKSKQIHKLHYKLSASQMKKYLEQNKCDFDDGYTCILTSCKCLEKKDKSVYVNKTTGFFVCLDCEDSGEWSAIGNKLKHELDTNSKNCLVIGEPSENVSRIVRRKARKPSFISEYETKWEILKKICRNMSSFTKEEINEIISTFKLRSSPDSDVLNELNALYDITEKVLYFPLLNNKKHVVGIKKLFVDGTEESDPSKQCYGLLKFIPNRVTKKCDKGIVVYNMKDFITLSSFKHSYHVICIPHEVLSLPQEMLPMLENYNRLVLWFGHDNINLNSARNFSKKLIEDRCCIITLTDKRPSDYFEESENVNISKICDSAEPVLHDSITTFANLKKEIWDELTDSDNAQGIKWRRFPALNDFLKGHRRGELTILTGPTGSGKTTFLSEYSLDIAQQGVSTLWGSFEIRNQRLASTMLQQLALEPLNDVQKFEFWAQEFEKLPIFFLKFHGQQSIDTVMHVINHAWYVHDIQHIVIDNLQFMLGLSVQEERYVDRFYQQDKVIASFRTFATQRNCHVTLIIHPRKEKDDNLTINSIFGSAKASQEADNILIIQKKMMETLHIKKYLQILKNRYTGDLGVIPLNFNKSTLSFSGKKIYESKGEAILESSCDRKFAIL